MVANIDKLVTDKDEPDLEMQVLESVKDKSKDNISNIEPGGHGED